MLCWRLVSSIGPHHGEGPQLSYITRHTSNIFKMKRSTGGYLRGHSHPPSPVMTVTDEIIQAIFMNTVDTRGALADVAVAIQGANEMITDLSQAFSAHISEYASAREDAGVKESIINILLREIEELEQKIVDLEDDACQLRDQIVERDQVIEQQKTKIQEQEGALRQTEDALRRTGVGRREKEMLMVGDHRQIREDHHLQVDDEGQGTTGRAAIYPDVCASYLLHMKQRRQEISDLKTQLRENNKRRLSQESHNQQLQEDNQRLQEDKNLLDEELRACRKNITDRIIVDCADYFRQGVRESGVYRIYPNSSTAGFRVYCKFEHGQAWTVFLSRLLKTTQVNFARPWQDYRDGFGDPIGEHWLGNEHLHLLTSGEISYTLRVDARNLQGELRTGEWMSFSVSDEANGYSLRVRGYSSVTSTLGDDMSYRDGMGFSTLDRDQDKWPGGHCAGSRRGGWWYKYCSWASPTAPLSSDDDDRWAVMSWAYFTPGHRVWTTLRELKMMVRRR